MREEFEEGEDLNALNLIYFLYRWRFPLFLVLGVSLVASVVFSSPWFILPKYKSVVIMYPVSTSGISKVLLNEINSPQQDVLEFGAEEQTEQMIQILNSNLIRDKVINKYDLLTHYGLKKTDRLAFTRLYDEYNSNIEFRRTENMAIKITVYDTDPQIAANIANDISMLYDSTKSVMQRERAQQAFKIVETEYIKLQSEIKAMEDSLTQLRKLGVYDYETQSEMMNQQLAIEIAKGNKTGIKALEDKLNILALYGGAYVSLRNQLEHEKKQLSFIKARFDQALVDATQTLPQKFVVNTAYPAEEKSYPIRWLIVLMSVFSSFILAVIVAAVLEKMDTVEKKKPGRQISTSRSPVSRILNFDPVKEIYKIIPEPVTVNLESMENYFRSVSILKLVMRWKLHLALILIFTFVLSIVFSGKHFIAPRFKSFAIAYPSNVAPYSDESETEQMLQLMQSGSIRDSVVKRFNLIAHYGIDTLDPLWRSTLSYEYGENIKINKTPFEAVMIEVFDTDPVLARDIINGIFDAYNQKVRVLHNEKFSEVVAMYKRHLDRKYADIDSLERRLMTLGVSYGLVPGFDEQSREIMRAVLRTGGNANPSSPEVVRIRKSMEEKGGELVYLVSRLKADAVVVSDYQKEYDIALMNLDRGFTYVNVVTSPDIPDKKATPVRWLIVVGSLFSVLLLSVLAIGVLENTSLRNVSK